MDCETCKKERAQEAGAVPRWTHEADMARMERGNKRLWIALLFAIAVIAGMVIYNAQFETVEIQAEQQADGDSNNYAVGGDYYGLPTESDNQA